VAALAQVARDLVQIALRPAHPRAAHVDEGYVHRALPIKPHPGARARSRSRSSAAEGPRAPP
jgi:hypothetical protein